MGFLRLLDYLVGNQKSKADRLVSDEQKREGRVALFNQHIANYAKRKALAVQFNFANVDKLLGDPVALDALMKQVEDSISEEIAHIHADEKSEEDVLSDLNSLMTKEELFRLTRFVVAEEHKEEHLIKLFEELLKILKAELHLVRLIKNHPNNTKDILIKLFELIFQHEVKVYMLFDENNFHDIDLHKHRSILAIAHAIILEEEIKKKVLSYDERFVSEVARRMESADSPKMMRQVAENIFDELFSRAGAPWSAVEAFDAGFAKMKDLLNDDRVMYDIIKKYRPNYTDAKLQIMISAFRKVFQQGHFAEMEMKHYSK